jgi:opacity protein-like surface antigen
MRTSLVLAVLLLSAGAAAAQDETEPPAVSEEPEGFKFGGEFKAGYRWSQAQESSIFGANNQVVGFMRTPDPGSSIELQHLGLTGEGFITSGVFARFEVRFSDLYNRNPTSTDVVVFVRQAFVRFGDKPELLSGVKGGRGYAQFGMAPRFTKQVTRHMESYGLLGTAVGRFEQPQLEVGASFGETVYARAMVGSGNPLFLRDTNALAGDNLSQAPAPNAGAVYQSGFPIFYDAKVTEINVGASPEIGFGAGVRWGGGDKTGVDLLGWYFQRRLADTARLRGTDYPGELAIFKGNGFPIPTSGDKRHEWGVNLQAKVKGLRFFGQWLEQDLAGASRWGLEAEASWTFSLPGLFLVGESVVGNWIQPSFRFSWLDNRFSAPRSFPRLAVQWPWKKYDFGLRFGVVRNVDLTAEYTFHEVFRTATLPNLPMKEFLLTLRTGF